MNDKYYVPEPGEIRIGLEVEIQTAFTRDYTKVTRENWDKLIRKLKADALRIKRLDTSDIEAEGWEKIGRRAWKLNNWQLATEEADGTGRTFITERSEHTLIFTIRNRLELSVLMRQLGITKEKTK